MIVISKSFSAFIVALSFTLLCIPLISADMGLMVSARRRLSNLLLRQKITHTQYDLIVNELADDEFLDIEMDGRGPLVIRPKLNHRKADAFRLWVSEQEIADLMTVDTADLIRNIFNLGTPSGRVAVDVPNGPVPAQYTENGVVSLLARENYSPDANYFQIYNGIWGYTSGSREYALHCNHRGLNILDVTTKKIVKVQTIQMSGGEIWRDVATHENYAYVAAQGYNNKNNAWVVDLSSLSSSSAQGEDSNPIRDNKIKNLGYNNWGHTINVWNGLLFLNDALRGCRIFDLSDTPMNPKELVTYDGECHDSFAQTIRGKDILISSDGTSGSWRVLDITNIRNPGFQFEILGNTETEFDAYAHESAVSDDGETLFVFEENNTFDIAAYDISNLRKPRLIRKFQWSGDANFDSYVHNGFVRGPYLHVAYYAAGYRVFDIRNIANGVVEEVGMYETFRDPNGDGNLENNYLVQDGGWNVYVGLANKVLVSDTKYGLYIFNVGENTPPTCKNSEYLFEAMVNTDTKGDEVKLTVKRKRNNGKWKMLKGLLENGLASNSATTIQKCLKKSKCYKFTISDKGEDGICCNNGDGSYKLKWNGKIIRESNFENKKKETKQFGSKCS